MRPDVISDVPLTVVFNPNARKPRLQPPCMDELRSSLAEGSRIHVTQSLEELDAVMRQHDRGCDATLCFYGGDGSIARGLTSFIRHRGEQAPLPPVLAVRAGTINMLCSILGLRERVDRTLARWNQNQFTRIREIPMIKVEVEGQAPQYGFIFAWGVGYRVLREYYDRAPVPTVWDALVVLMRTLVGGLNPNANATPMYRCVDVKVSVNGKPIEAAPLRALTVGTIERASLGLRPYPVGPREAGGFSFSGNGMPIRRVVWHFPTLLFGLGDQQKLAHRLGPRLITGSSVRELECFLPEGFTMDGEMFDLPFPTRVKISPGPVARFWTQS